MPDYPQPDDSLSSLERARQRLYTSPGSENTAREPLVSADRNILPHAWKAPLATVMHHASKRVRLAGLFFAGAVLFFLVALGISAYLLYFGGNAVSVNNIDLQMQGPTTIAGGDTFPLSLAITNRNSVPINNATLEVDFPTGTRSSADVLQDFPRYTENLGTLAPGVTITRSIKAVVFGGEGQALSVPVSLSYGTDGSNAVFVKKVSYSLGISTAPLSVSVEAPTEAVSGKPFTITLTARSNASAPLSNVVVAAGLPFGFSLASSSPTLQNSSFVLGTLAPGASRVLRITGVLVGEDASTRSFHFAIGTASAAGVPTLAVSYMQQDATLILAAPFIRTTLALNGDTSGNAVVQPGTRQTVTISYTNMLATSVMNATVQVALAGANIDYASIQTSNGFYNSATHSVIFNRDTDSSLSSLAPSATGLGTFTFATLPSSTGGRNPLITLTTSVSGTRVGQANVPEVVSASSVTTAKVTTAIALSAGTLHSSGPFVNSGPIPPKAGSATTYTIVWQLAGGGNAIAGASVSATLPSYVSYSGKTSGSGSFSYDEGSRTVRWAAGDLPAGASSQASFQVSLTPSTSQRGSSPALTSAASLTAFDRYAQVSLSAQAPPATTETVGDPGYSPSNATVQ